MRLVPRRRDGSGTLQWCDDCRQVMMWRRRNSRHEGFTPTKCSYVRIFKRVVARRAVYHTLNVITISLYVCPSVCVERVLGGGWLDPLLKKMVSEHH